MKILSSIKKDMEFNKGLSSLIEILKNIAIAQYRALERKVKPYEKLNRAIGFFFELIEISKVSHQFLKAKNNSQIVIAVTSDTGLLGGLNTRVVARALNELEKMPGLLVVIGERGKVYARQTNIPFVGFTGIKDEERHFQAMQLRDYVIDRLLKESIGYLKIVYPRALSLTAQRVEIMPLLPYTMADKKAMPGETYSEIIFESKPGDIVEYLIYLWMGEMLDEIFGLSRLAEFAARFVHLEESSQKLKDMEKKIRLQYFRVRHELIDRNMRELFAARLLYANK